MNPSTQPSSRPADLDTRILACPPGGYPWDDWQREAAAAGVAPDLASLGRAVMREAYQHDWCHRLKYECGIDNPDTAAGMVTSAKDQPQLTAARWQWLLATDGLRFDPWERNEWSEESLEWREMRRRWDAETDKDLQPDVALQREACRYIEDFYDLDQLALIDLTGHAIGRADGQTTLWADFTVIDGVPHRIAHSGVVRIERTSGSSDIDAAIFERVEES
jgi:hypothetical protein